LLPSLAAGQSGTKKEQLLSGVFRFEDMEARKSGAITLRQILKGDTHTGLLVDLHESELPGGQSPHAPHHHLHEEMLLVREGTMEVTIAGKVSRLGPGSVAYIASNQQHGYRNPASTPVAYFVLALGTD